MNGLDPMQIINIINIGLSVMFFLCFAYQAIYTVVPFINKLDKHKSPDPDKKHRFAVMISARNEEAVIGNLIDSIHAQDYPSELVTIFVCADNCTDTTASVCRDHGCVVYERNNLEQIGKGYALKFMLAHIAEDYGEDAFDAFFVFDADNVLPSNYITEMNRTYNDGYEAITSYRNSKNYGDNWISAGYGLWFLHEAKYLNHPRMALGTSCAISGTGFMVSKKMIDINGGWNFFMLTEDVQFSVNNIVNRRKIGYCANAMVYDEQPTNFGQSFTQRMRWVRGNLQVMFGYFFKLIKGMFTGNFACYDIMMAVLPPIVISALGVILNVAMIITSIITKQDLMLTVTNAVSTVVTGYLGMTALAAITTITEWKRIPTTNGKKILYTFTFPLFMASYIPIYCAAFFAKVGWKPIIHTSTVKIDDINKLN